MERSDNDLNNVPLGKEGSQEQGGTKTNLARDGSFFINQGVKGCKNKALKIKCESKIEELGMSNEQFYVKTEISRQQWYYWSWGLLPFPTWLKIRLCDLYGKSFRDLFLNLEEKKN